MEHTARRQLLHDLAASPLLEPAARHALAAAPAHFGHLESSVDDDTTLKANRAVDA